MRKILPSFIFGAVLLQGVNGYMYQKSAVEWMMGATVKIETTEGWGSGTVISSKFIGDKYVTYVLTNAHVVGELKNAILHSYKYVGSKMVGQSDDNSIVVAVDDNLDLALLKYVRGDQFPDVIPLAKEDVQPLEHVTAIGAALGRIPIVTEGIVTDVRDGILYESAAITPGDSGGTLLNDRHELVGLPEKVATYGVTVPFGMGAIPVTQPHMAMAVPVSTVWQFLKEQHIKL